jgi:NADPH:quinone reductase-like Zn-dependent oxidoreductase
MKTNIDEVKGQLKALGADIVIRDIDLTDRDVVKSITSIRLVFNCVGGKTTLNMLKLLASDVRLLHTKQWYESPLFFQLRP